MQRGVPCSCWKSANGLGWMWQAETWEASFNFLMPYLSSLLLDRYVSSAPPGKACAGASDNGAGIDPGFWDSGTLRHSSPYSSDVPGVGLKDIPADKAS